MKKKRGVERVTRFITEHCANPWKGGCRNTNVALYILYKGSRLPICQSCWNDITDKSFEWGESYAF